LAATLDAAMWNLSWIVPTFMKNFFHDLYERIRESAVALRFGPFVRTKIVDETAGPNETRILYLIWRVAALVSRLSSALAGAAN